MIFDKISYYIDILFVVPVIFIILTIQYIATPRIGMVKLSRKRMRRNTWFIVTVTIILVTMVNLTIIGDGHTNYELIIGRWIVSGIMFFIYTAIAFF